MSNTLPTIAGPATPVADNGFNPDGFTHKIAVIVDGIVQDIMFTRPRSAALLLSEPIMIDVTHLPELQPGYTWDAAANQFKRPTQESIAAVTNG
jgi:hypothetical protein